MYTLGRGVCRISQRGGGPILNFLGFFIYMPQSGMSRAAKLRAFAMGVRGKLGACPPPQENFKKCCNFVRFEGYFQHFHGKKFSQKIINKHKFFTDPFIMLLHHH